MSMARAPRLGASGDSLCSAVFAISGAWLVWLASADIWLGDSAEVGSAAYALGVAHPTGFPLDMLLLRLSAFLPLGPLAFRENVAVALISALALGKLADLALLLCE